MPVKKVGKKYEVNGKDFDTEEAANKAYMEYLAKAMGVKPPTPPELSPGKKGATKKTSDDK